MGNDHPDVAQSLNNLANLYSDTGRYQEAEPLLKEALAIRRKRLGNDHPSVAQSLNNLAVLYYETGRYQEAEPLYKEALAIYRKLFGNDHPDVARSLNNLAVLYKATGRYQEAEPLYKEALAIYRKTLGNDHPLVAQSLNNLALLYSDTGRYQEAEPLYKEALAIYRKRLGNDHPAVAASLNNLATLYHQTGRYQEAEPLLNEALAIYRKRLGNDHPDVAASLNNLANLYEATGRYQEAEPLYKEALAIRRKRLGNDHPLVAASLNNLAFLYHQTGRYQEAEPLIDEAITILDRHGQDPEIRYRAYGSRALVKWATDRRREAVADLEEALGTIEWQRAQFFAPKTYPFELMASWQAELGDAGGVFSAMERSRARVLLEQLELAGQDLLAGLPQAQAQQLRQKEAEAAARVSSLRKQLEVLSRRQDLSEGQKQQEAERLEGELAAAQWQYMQVRAELRGASPVYRLALQKDRQPVGLDQVRLWAEKQKALVLEYLVGRKESYVLVIPAGGPVRVEKLEMTQAEAKLLEGEAGPLTEQVLEAILRGREEGARQEAASGQAQPKRVGLLEALAHASRPEQSRELAPKLRALWELLVPQPERKALLGGQYELLVVVPDRALALVPFEALVVTDGEPVRYLVDRGPPVLYAPSCTVLLQLEARESKGAAEAKEPVLLVGHCRYQAAAEPGGQEVLGQLAARNWYARLGGRLVDLPSTALELDWLNEVFQRGGQKVARLREQWATERNVRGNVAGRRVVHFATHGLVDQSWGNLFGALALTPGSQPDQAQDDGYLTLGEIVELPFGGCELVVLSACSTNVGPEQRGEGVHGLARGFLVAGARRVVASQWEVADEATAHLMAIFAQYVAKDQKAGRPVDHAAALHKAKRWMREHGKEQGWQEPFFWAPFILIGPR